MLLDLREMRGSEERVDRTFAADEISADPGDDYTIVGPVVLRLRLLKDGDKFRLKGRVESRLRLSCGRCLESFEVPADLPIDLMYLPQTENGGDGESEISDEDLSTGFYRDDQIDLGLVVREQFQLSLPMKPLCGDGCRGLCPVCGANLNSERCSCDTTWRDPRLETLESLLSDSRKG